MPAAYRQEVLNVLLVQLLQDSGITTAPESILHSGPDHARSMPDVLIDYQGLRLAIEGAMANHGDLLFTTLIDLGCGVRWIHPPAKFA